MEFAIVDLADIDINAPDHAERVPCIVVRRFEDLSHTSMYDDAPEVAEVVVYIRGEAIRRYVPAGLLIDPSTLSAR